MYSLSEDKLTYARVSYSLLLYRCFLILPQEISCLPGVLCAQRSGRHLCIATADVYGMVDLAGAQMYELLPLSQVPEIKG
jgi:hypothetical protein